MFEVNAATVDARVEGIRHFLNVITADDTAIAGVTFDADAKPFRNFLCHCSGVLMLGFRFGVVSRLRPASATACGSATLTQQGVSDNARLFP